jgi:hypothetical protein
VNAALLALVPLLASGRPGTDPKVVHGMTISCQTWGWEWGSDGFGAELDELAKLGVNWVAIHPYGSIRADGTISTRRYEADPPPDWIVRPIREAHARGISILVIPHLAYWGSPWSWRGAIEFPDPACRARFFETYTAWMTAIARAAKDADGFSIGNETDKLVCCEKEWRAVIAAVRKETSAKLTYAANFDSYPTVPFWDALDAVGVQAYFPLSDAKDPTDDDLREGWRRAIDGLRAISVRTGKPVVCTELGYDLSSDAARRPWESGRGRREDEPTARALQERCLRIGLEETAREKDWLRGAFLWKWFVGPARHEDFRMQAPEIRGVIASVWGTGGR